MLKNIVEPNRPQMKMRRMSIAGWILKATNTHSEYLILIAFAL
jgi:Rps23 Pro-64 3,4-dihydroxylase Tpa1-like proline 4-hydroxylase